METVHFRQGAGRLCLDFVRTLRHRGTPEPAEELPDAAALAVWVRQCGPGGLWESGPQEVPQKDLSGEARRLREAIYELLRAGTGSCGAESTERINRAAAHPVPAPSLDASGRLRWQADDPVPATLALAARDALDLVTSAAIARVRECADPDCSALFLDNSRPGTRRWCSMDACGNRAKKSTLRKKAVVVRPESSAGASESIGV
jgi:predicted RNA-binding Zn ribbon-like protein